MNTAETYRKCKTMNYKQFTSNQEWVNFHYPSNIISEEEGTYLFYTEHTGSFRVTPLKLEDNGNFNADKYLENLSNDYNGEILKNPSGKYVYYISYSMEEDEKLLIFNWIFAANKKIVYCSYTIDDSDKDHPEILKEKDEILKIINNLKID